MEVLTRIDPNGNKIKEIIESHYFILESLKKFYEGRNLQTDIETMGENKWKLTINMGKKNER